MKKSAFTLVEILLSLTVVGVLAAIMIANVNSKKIDIQTNISQAYKTIESFEQASAKIRESETTTCPMAAFMVQVAGAWQYALVGVSSNAAVRNLFGRHMKFVPMTTTERNDLVNNTNVFSNTDTIEKLPTGAYVKFVYNGTLPTCPSHYIFEDILRDRKTAVDAGRDVTNGFNVGTFKRTAINSMGQTATCWATITVDVNGKKAPNRDGIDQFTFGLGEYGVAR